MKNTKKKRRISVALCVLMLANIFALSAFAVEHKHTFQQEIIQQADGCTLCGVKALVCQDADCRYVEEGSKAFYYNEHNYQFAEYVIEPTANTAGLEKLVCSVCGESFTRDVPPTGHEIGEWETVQAATCTQLGKEQAWCATCGKYVVRNTGVVGHKQTVLAKVPATCTERGKEEGRYCILCNQVTVAQKIIAPLGHVYYTIPDIEAPTCNSTGKGHTYCSREGCTFSEVVDVDRLDHVDENGDAICDVCEGTVCRCFCHKDTFIARFVRWLNTNLSKLLKKDFRCCDCMQPLKKL